MLASLRYALRQLRNSPGFAVTAIVTLALGIGATTVIFSVLDAVLLRPLPFPHAERLVAIAAGPDQITSIPTMRDWQSRGASFASIAGYKGWAPTVRSSLGSHVDNLVIVTQNFLPTLGATYALGHGLPMTGNEQDCTGEAVVSASYWQRLGGGTPLNRSLEINQRSFQIVGVLPLAEEMEGSGSLNRPEIFVPVGCDPWEGPDARGDMGFRALGRMKPGVSLAAASADLARVQRTLRRDYPNDYGEVDGGSPAVIPWITQMTGTSTGPALYATLAACGLLLVIGCANLANLLLARSVKRRREFALRATLGASLGQLLRQLLVESAVLAVVGAAGGIALAYGMLPLLRTVRAVRIPRLEHASISPAALAFTICVTAAVSILLTVLPARRTLRPELIEDLGNAGRSSGAGSLRRVGRVLVAAQIAFTLVLVACAGWAVASVYALLHQPLGFDPGHLLMAGVDIDRTSVTPRYSPEETRQFFSEMAERLRALPGVTAVTATNHPPLGSATDRFGFCSDAHPEQCQRPVALNPDSYHVLPGYFATVGQTLLAGRDFTADDNGARHVAIVNRALAEREWPGQDAVGRRVWSGDLQDWATVVGVVGNVHSYDLESAPGPDLYMPAADHPKTAMVFLIRTKDDPSLLQHTVLVTLKRGHADLAFYHVRSMREEMAGEVELRGFLMQMAAAFGGVALFLAVLGTYGLLAYEVSLREKEIGIRLALGSTRAGIVELLLGQESRWVLGGAVVGVCVAALAGYGLRALYYHAQAAMLPVLAVSFALLVLPSLLAIAVPARRAAMLDPVETLRRE